MRISSLIAAFAIPMLLATFPIAAAAQQQTNTMAQPAKFTPDQVKSAVKQALMSVGLTMQQKRSIRGMVQGYEQQTANADDATKQAAQKTLLKNIYGQLTPDQQTKFKASIKQSLGADVEAY
jgi:hypothetical protein